MIDEKRIVVALDYPQSNAALQMAEKLDPALCRVKVGKELFTHSGPEVVRQLHRLGFQVFLDLKYHDIPATVSKALRAAVDLGVWMVNVHSMGGTNMLRAAREAVPVDSGCKLIAVTVLTSMDNQQLAELGWPYSAEELVVKLAGLAQDCGLDGVVCSAQEAPLLRKRLGSDLTLVTPGIRPEGAAKDDQSRIVAPAQAVRDGANYLVIGRPVTQATDPILVMNAIQKEITFR